MIIETIIFGDELLDGRRVDTNSSWLGRRLSVIGIPPKYRQTVSDDIDEIAQAFRLAFTRADIILTTGGLGPTSDDLTFEGLAAALDLELVYHEEIFREIEGKFRKKGLRCPPSNKRQAHLPEGAVPLPNDWGTAPGLKLETNGKVIFSFPGVPREMENLFERDVLPELEARVGVSDRRREEIYKFFGMGESHLEERVRSCKFEEIGNIRIAYTASFPEITVTLSIQADSEAALGRVAQESDRRLRAELGDKLVARGAETVESRVLDSLRVKGWKLAVAESLTGGLLASCLIEVPGSSDVFERGLVTYSNASKVELLDVSEATLRDHGAVSEACAREMARGAKSRASVDVALATTGIAGPTGGTKEKPVGLTYIAWVGPGFEEVREYQFRWDRNRNRMLATYEALATLSRFLESSNPKT